MKKQIHFLKIVSASILVFFAFSAGSCFSMHSIFSGQNGIADAAAFYAPSAESRLKPAFDQNKMCYPPEKVALLAIKSDKVLELWTKSLGKWHKIKNYYILAASGNPGPKLRAGDKQVPEGVYRISNLNPNSSFHLSMKLNYPNAFDLYYAEQDGRKNLGSNIHIHGSYFSIGCIAMGDKAIEELFVLSHRVGIDNIKVFIVPTDPRKGKLTPVKGSPDWVSDLYEFMEYSLMEIIGTGRCAAKKTPLAGSYKNKP